MVTVPAIRPETSPVLPPIVARAGILLNHVPPPASVKVVVVPGQTWSVPDIGLGFGLTVTGLVIRHSGDS